MLFVSISQLSTLNNKSSSTFKNKVLSTIYDCDFAFYPYAVYLSPHDLLDPLKQLSVMSVVGLDDMRASENVGGAFETQLMTPLHHLD